MCANWVCAMDGVLVENWRPIVGYEGLYEVSDLGRVKRTGKGRGAMPGHVLTPRITSRTNQYLRVTLNKGGKIRPHRVHGLVLAAFIGPRPTGLEIDHINNNKQDNRLCNLEYVTSSENKLRAYRAGVRVGPRGSNCGTSKLTEGEVVRIRDLLSKIRTGELVLSHRMVAEQFDVSRACVSFINTGRSWGHLQAASA